jgi:serine/threonine-protein kinase
MGEKRTDAKVACVAAEPTVSTPPEGVPRVSSQVGDFRLVRKLGQGAMATVYKARQVSFNRDVALKILFKHIAENPKLVERFYREARISGRLEHPNIVQGFGVGEHEGLHYFAMEFVDGESLQKWLVRLGPMEVGDAVHITLACARGLQYAHDLGLVHRDIKPDNVLISWTGEIKLADLGMVKMLEEDMALTQTGHAVGTPWYMPLEQARNAKDTDGRCDIYALGCMLYHMLAGRPPFVGPTLVDLIREKEGGAFPAARNFNADVPERLDLIVAKMAAKHPRHRYQNCAEVIDDLEALQLASEQLTFLSDPIAARPKDRSQLAADAAPREKASPAVRDALSDEWLVRYRGSTGWLEERVLSTAEVLRMIGEGLLGPTAQASRGAKDVYRSLATYREFEQAMLSKATRSAADQRTVRFRTLYKKIEEQDRNREKAEKTVAKQVSKGAHTLYWLGLALKIILPLAALGGLLWFLSHLAKGISG